MTALKVKQLKDNNEDFEWYPTSNEILECIKEDFKKSIYKKIEKSNIYDTDGFDNIGFSEITATNCPGFKETEMYGKREKQKEINIESFLDIGTGDGRVFDFFTNDSEISIRKKYGIEKASLQADDLIKKNITLIGRDFFKNNYIDHNYDIVFSNPPYSIFKQWCTKLLNEIDSYIKYLVIPKRWKNDQKLKDLIYSKGDVEILGSFDFLNADREARAKIDIIKITKKVETENLFNKWVEDNIGSFRANEKIELDDIKTFDEVKNSIKKVDKTETIAILVKNYNEDLLKLSDTYRALGKIDFKLIKHLGIEKYQILRSIRDDIKNLKNRYWRTTFDLLKPINSRLTFNVRNGILDNIRWIEKLDFNEENIRTCIIFFVNNSNKYVKEQLLDIFHNLSCFENIKYYKSNDKWENDDWRYKSLKDKDSKKYKLDYRIIVEDYRINNKHHGERNNTILNDLCVVANTLGFYNDNIIFTYFGSKKIKCFLNDKSEDENEVLFEYRIYKNNNVHIKLSKRFLRVLNIEVGKLRGWLRSPDDIVDEFEISKEEAKKMFIDKNLKLMEDKSVFLLN